KAARRRGIHPIVVSNDDTGMDKYAAAKLGFDPTNLAATLRGLADAVHAARDGAPHPPHRSPSRGGFSLRVRAAGQDLAAAKRGLVIYDERALDGPDGPAVLAALRALEKVPFLLVQTPLLTPAAQLADVVLPSAGFAEEDGTLTNLEGRVQSLGRATVIPGEARDGWEILALLSNRLGVVQTYESAAA